VLILTDGRDTCETPDPVERVQTLAAAGVSTFVVGFDGSGKGIDASTLNNMACAGKTAPDFASSCADSGGGAYVAADPEGAPLFLPATSGKELKAMLASVAGLVGCADVY
ncbi:MAG: VWA domain-containing protein, partial [Myxococcota bacterium]|nr:VWA domain-containing protein [Myxococcota bacterium]